MLLYKVRSSYSNSLEDGILQDFKMAISGLNELQVFLDVVVSNAELLDIGINNKSSRMSHP